MWDAFTNLTRVLHKRLVIPSSQSIGLGVVRAPNRWSRVGLGVVQATYPVVDGWSGGGTGSKPVVEGWSGGGTGYKPGGRGLVWEWHVLQTRWSRVGLGVVRATNPVVEG